MEVKIETEFSIIEWIINHVVSLGYSDASQKITTVLAWAHGGHLSSSIPD